MVDLSEIFFFCRVLNFEFKRYGNAEYLNVLDTLFMHNVENCLVLTSTVCLFEILSKIIEQFSKNLPLRNRSETNIVQ